MKHHLTYLPINLSSQAALLTLFIRQQHLEGKFTVEKWQSGL